MGYAIRDDRPLPKPHKPTVYRSKYPYARMEVGQWFFVPGHEVSRLSLQRYTYAAGRRLGCKFAVRAIEGGYGVWRLE